MTAVGKAQAEQLGVINLTDRSFSALSLTYTFVFVTLGTFH